MSITEELLADEATHNALIAGLEDPSSPAAGRVAEFVAAAAGHSAMALIHYGSHVQRSDAHPESAYDFFLIVSDYLDAYRCLQARVGTSYGARTAAILNRVLPPNVIAVRVREAPAATGKVAVLTLADLRRGVSSRAKDHFVAGRLFQQVQLVWARDPASRSAVRDAVAEARARTFEWGQSYLPPVFDATIYCEHLLRRSYAAEIRPEEPGRVIRVLDSQREAIVPSYEAVLRRLVALGRIEPAAAGYQMTSPPSRLHRWRVEGYFFRSKWRAVARWLKYVALYDDWLDYIARKVARRGGMSVVLTERERRHPLVFLWPTVWRYLRSRTPRHPRSPRSP